MTTALLLVCGLCVCLNFARAQEGLVAQSWLDQPPLTAYQKSLFKRYPDALSCLPDDARREETTDLGRFEWSSIRNDDHAMVCVYRIAEHLGTPEAMRDWFGRYGFIVSPEYQIGSATAIQAVWKLDGQWPLYPGMFSFSRYLKRFFYIQFSVYVYWGPSALGSVQIAYSSE